VNYGLVRIIPPAGTVIDDDKRPFVMFDPRAGHGPSIGGMKHDSEIGKALEAGHPCYFVGFLPNPVPGQTVEDVCRAEARFVEVVAARHPHAEGKPVLIGNCQAGWQIMMMSAIRPDLPGPILVVGSPFSYWAGIRGQSPMRYLGGLLGGTWLTSLAGDLGCGIFDGASLVSNFEQAHPENHLWKKLYDVYAKVDTEAPRFLEFEKWWGSPVLLNAEEMQYITDNLFVGNRLGTGQMHTSDGLRIDLRNIRSPIIVFCSWGDDITPPPQALGWVLDLYERDEEVVSNGQTIVYTLHPSVGHLGIFVSGKVATKEHGELVKCMDLIDLMPPGIYEAVITEVDEDTGNPELVHGRYLFALEKRSLDDIRALVRNNPADDLRFEAVARLSEVNQGLYASLVRPAVRAMATPFTAETMRALHPDRLRFTLFSDHNPFMAPVGPLADLVRQNRCPADPGNPLTTLEHLASDCIEFWLKSWSDARNVLTEQVFLSTFGSPALQACVGLAADNAAPRGRIGRNLTREAAASATRAEAEAAIARGGVIEAFVRAVMYIARPAALTSAGLRPCRSSGPCCPSRSGPASLASRRSCASSSWHWNSTRTGPSRRCRSSPEPRATVAAYSMGLDISCRSGRRSVPISGQGWIVSRRSSGQSWRSGRSGSARTHEADRRRQEARAVALASPAGTRAMYWDGEVGFWQILVELSRRDRVTIFLSTHFMNVAERCDRVSLMNAGKVLVSDAGSADHAFRHAGAGDPVPGRRIPVVRPQFLAMAAIGACLFGYALARLRSTLSAVT
jgi:hypothetical protein